VVYHVIMKVDAELEPGLLAAIEGAFASDPRLLRRLAR
jgi:hypothetical protein